MEFWKWLLARMFDELMSPDHEDDRTGSFYCGIAVKTWFMLALMASTCWRSVTF